MYTAEYTGRLARLGLVCTGARVSWLVAGTGKKKTRDDNKAMFYFFSFGAAFRQDSYLYLV